jgi:hypothetical protein
MTSTVKVVPQFMPPVEVQGIVATNTIDVPLQMPNLTRTLVTQNDINHSDQGIQFQATNVSAYIESDFLLSFDWTFKLTGQTLTPDDTAHLCSPSALWSPESGGVTPLMLNKLINYIQFNIGEKSWTESDSRIYPELIDVYASQFDQKKLEEQGIFNWDLSGLVKTRRAVGNGVALPSALNTAGNNVWQYGEGNRLSNWHIANSPFLKALKRGYVEIVSNVFTTTDGTKTLKSVFDGVSLRCIDSATGADYYTCPSIAAPGADILTQVVTIRVNEYLISPSTTCSKYTKKQYSKSYATFGNQVSLQLQFNSDFLKNGAFVIMPPRIQGLAVPTCTAPTLNGGNIKFYTFDCNKEYLSDTLRIYYSKISRENCPFVAQTIADSVNNNTLMSRTVSSPNMKSLPRFLLLYVTSRLWENPSYPSKIASGPYSVAIGTAASVANLSELAPYVLNPLTNVQITWGAQADVVFGVDATMRDLIDLTMETLQNPEMREIIASQKQILQCGSGFNMADLLSGNAINDDLFLRGTNANQRQVTTGGITNEKEAPGYGYGAPFLLLDLTRLNFKPVDKSNIPCIPMFNFGSIAYRSLTITMSWNANPDLIRSVDAVNSTTDTLQLQYNPFILYAQDYIRSIPMRGSGGVMGNDEVEFSYFADTVELRKIIDDYNQVNNSTAYGHMQEEFVGGANLFGNLFAKVKKALPYVAPALKLAHSFTKGHSGHLGTAHNLSGKALEALAHVGLGRKRKY